MYQLSKDVLLELAIGGQQRVYRLRALGHDLDGLQEAVNAIHQAATDGGGVFIEPPVTTEEAFAFLAEHPYITVRAEGVNDAK